ncbi:hypothetical protein D1872_303020 [compost metagenome]
MGACRRHVGRAGPEHSERRIAGAPDVVRTAILRGRVRQAVEDRVAARYVRILCVPAAAAEAGRHFLLHDDQAELE